ncbi:MAG TPA: hypothetical protein VK646_02200 [Actinomycetota bacterium]|nr:hypothetical protein [Actinomycetota bacterium]
MTDDTKIPEFLQQMADEVDVSAVDPRRPAERAHRRRAVAKVLVFVVAAAAIVTAGAVGLGSVTTSGFGPAGHSSQSLKTVNVAVYGWGGPGGYSVQVPPGWNLDVNGHSVSTGTSGTLGVSVWNVKRVPQNPCQWKETLRDPGPTVDDLVGAIEQTQLRTATAPTNVVLDGFSGKYLEWSVPDWHVSGNADFQGCDDPGNGHQDFVTWLSNLQGEAYAQVAHQVDMLWILEVRGHRLVVDATYGPNDSKADRDQLTGIVESLHFWQYG